MRIDSQFPSNYLKAADLQGRHVTATMSHVDIEKIGDDQRPVLKFVGKEKGLVLNKTNSNTISEIYGFETDDWQGRQITLVEAMVDFQGRSVPAIRVRAPVKTAARRPAAAAAPPPADDDWAGSDPLPPDDLPQAPPPERPAQPAARAHVAAPNGHVPRPAPAPAQQQRPAALVDDEIPF